MCLTSILLNVSKDYIFDFKCAKMESVYRHFHGVLKLHTQRPIALWLLDLIYGHVALKKSKNSKTLVKHGKCIKNWWHVHNTQICFNSHYLVKRDTEFHSKTTSINVNHLKPEENYEFSGGKKTCTQHFSIFKCLHYKFFFKILNFKSIIIYFSNLIIS